MLKFKDFFKTKRTITAILFFVLIYLVYKFCCNITGVKSLYNSVMDLRITILKFILSAGIIIFLTKAKWVGPKVLSFKNTGKALILCSVIVVILLIKFTVTIYEKKPDLSSIELIQYLLGLIAVGIFEEFFFRLGVLHILLNKWHNTSLDIKLVCFLAGFVFGAVHIGNLFIKDISLSYVIGQVFFAIGFGSFASAVYMRSRNIWGLVIIHAFNDFSIYTGGSNITAVPVFSIIEYLLLWFILTVFLLRKKKMKKILENIEFLEKGGK